MNMWTLTQNILYIHFFGVELKSAYKLMSCTHYQITFISLQYLLHLVCRWKNGWIEEFLQIHLFGHWNTISFGFDRSGFYLEMHLQLTSFKMSSSIVEIFNLFLFVCIHDLAYCIFYIYNKSIIRFNIYNKVVIFGGS